MLLKNYEIMKSIHQKLADLENILVWTYEKGPQSIRLDPESNTYILDDYSANNSVFD